MSEQLKSWHGNIAKYIDEIAVEQFMDVTTGCFGGSSEGGAHKNEDGYLIIKPTDDSTFAVIFDGHATNSSVIYMIDKLVETKDAIVSHCKEPTASAMLSVPHLVTKLIQSEQVRHDCEGLTGETAMLICFQKEAYVWWLSVGDNLLYVFHTEFNALGQYHVNSRIFYQWIGKRNSLSLEVPCFSAGTLQLREGENQIVLLTDGVLEIEGRPFEDNARLADLFHNNTTKASVEFILNEVRKSKGRDSATVLSWVVKCNHQALKPST